MRSFLLVVVLAWCRHCAFWIAEYAQKAQNVWRRTSECVRSFELRLNRLLLGLSFTELPAYHTVHYQIGFRCMNLSYCSAIPACIFFILHFRFLQFELARNAFSWLVMIELQESNLALCVIRCGRGTEKRTMRIESIREERMNAISYTRMRISRKVWFGLIRSTDSIEHIVRS